MLSSKSPTNQDFSRETALTVLRQYPALTLDDLQFVPIDQGQANQAARLIIGQRQYIFKRLGPGPAGERQKFTAEVQLFLARAGFPCPEIILNGQGESLSSDGSFFYSLQSWLEGDHFAGAQQENPSPSLAKKLGSTLGKLHSILATDEITKHTDCPQATLEKQISGLAQARQTMFQAPFLRPSPYWKMKLKPGKTDFDFFVLEVLPVWKKAVLFLESWLPAQKNNFSRLAPVHGDINWENILLLPGDQCALLDFDNVQLQPPACEIGAALAILCPFPGPAKDHFLTGYSEQDLPVPDSDTLENLVLLKYARSFSWQIQQWYYSGNRSPQLKPWVIFLGQGLKKSWDHKESPHS